jgi:tetratricopeptide (TPR) repeat protein
MKTSMSGATSVFHRLALTLSLFGLVLPLVVIPTNAVGAEPDTTPPTLRILEPATGTEVGSDELTVEIEYRDTESGIAVQTLHVLLNGKDYAGQFDQHNRGASGHIRLPKSLPAGDNRLTAEIADRAGNVARVETLVKYEGPPEEQYNAGLMHAKAGRWNEAAASFSKVVKFDPKDADAHVQLGHAYQYLKRYPEAVAAYRQATTLRPDDLEAVLSLGDASMQMKDYGGATIAYRNATELDSKNGEAFKSLGIAYRADKKYPDAKEALWKARLLNPQDADIYSQIGLVELAQQNYLLAQMSFRRAVLMNPNSTPAYIGLGQACLERARYEKAVEAFNHALQVNPRSAKARFGLGVAYLSLKDRGKAQEQLTLLAEVNKELAEELNRRLLTE